MNNDILHNFQESTIQWEINHFSWTLQIISRSIKTNCLCLMKQFLARSPLNNVLDDYGDLFGSREMYQSEWTWKIQKCQSDFSLGEKFTRAAQLWKFVEKEKFLIFSLTSIFTEFSFTEKNSMQRLYVGDQTWFWYFRKTSVDSFFIVSLEYVSCLSTKRSFLIHPWRTIWCKWGFSLPISFISHIYVIWTYIYVIWTSYDDGAIKQTLIFPKKKSWIFQSQSSHGISLHMTDSLSIGMLCLVWTLMSRPRLRRIVSLFVILRVMQERYSDDEELESMCTSTREKWKIMFLWNIVKIFHIHVTSLTRGSQHILDVRSLLAIAVISHVIQQ